MKANNKPSPSDNTYANRVSQFEKQLKEKEILPSSSPQPVTSKENPYLIAHQKALLSLPPWKQVEIVRMSLENNTDNRFYDEFIAIVLSFMNEIPSLTLRNRIKGV